MATGIIRDSPASKQGGNSQGKFYNLPVRVCATCGQTTKGSFHERCRRVKGKLVVVVEEPRLTIEGLP